MITSSTARRQHVIVNLQGVDGGAKQLAHRSASDGDGTKGIYSHPFADMGNQCVDTDVGADHAIVVKKVC